MMMMRAFAVLLLARHSVATEACAEDDATCGAVPEMTNVLLQHTSQHDKEKDAALGHPVSTNGRMHGKVKEEVVLGLVEEGSGASDEEHDDVVEDDEEKGELDEEDEDLEAAKQQFEAEHETDLDAFADTGLPAGVFKICLTTGVPGSKSITYKGQTYTWQQQYKDHDCQQSCTEGDGTACDEGGSIADSCKCVDVTSEADSACSGKADGEQCSFDSPLLTVPDKTLTNKYESVCHSRMENTLSCYPRRALYCHTTSKVNGKHVVTYSVPGGRCFTNQGRSTSSTSGSTFQLWTYSLSYCELKETSDGNTINAPTQCKSGYNPQLPAAEWP